MSLAEEIEDRNFEALREWKLRKLWKVAPPAPWPAADRVRFARRYAFLRWQARHYLVTAIMARKEAAARARQALIQDSCLQFRTRKTNERRN